MWHGSPLEGEPAILRISFSDRIRIYQGATAAKLSTIHDPVRNAIQLHVFCGFIRAARIPLHKSQYRSVHT